MLFPCQPAQLNHWFLGVSTISSWEAQTPSNKFNLFFAVFFYFFQIPLMIYLFFLDKVVDIEKGTISQVDPLGERNSDFFYVVRYVIRKIKLSF